MKIYTKTGDQGKTSLLGGGRVYKDDLYLDAYGTCDELNSFLGLLLSNIDKSQRDKLAVSQNALIFELQNQLFLLGARLSCKDEETFNSFKMRRLSAGHCRELETAMDALSCELSELNNFILPGGSMPSSMAHVCRTVTRRLERLMVKLNQASPELSLDIELIFVNRLSDYFFVLARWLNKMLGQSDVLMNLSDSKAD